MAVPGNTTGTDQEDSSAGAAIRKYLAAHGQDYTAANVRAALAANARETGQSGPDLIEGLRNYGTSNDPGVGQKGSAAKKIESSGPVNLGNVAPAVESGPNPGGSDNKVSSAPPSSNLDVSNMILTGLGLGGAGAAGLYGASKYFGRDMPIGGDAARAVPNFRLADQYGPPQATPTVGDSVPAVSDTVDFVGRGNVGPSGRVMDVDPTMIGRDAQLALPGPSSTTTDPMALALDRAVAPAAIAAPAITPQTTAPAQITGPIATPADVATGLPPGVTPLDVGNAQLRANPTLALPAAGRGAVTGGSPQVGANAIEAIRNALVGAMRGRVRMP